MQANRGSKVRRWVGAVLGGVLLAVALPAVAQAACTVTLTAPPDNSVQTPSPRFRWTGTADCAQYRVQFSPSGGFELDRLQGPWQTATQYKLSEATWDYYQADDSASKEGTLFLPFSAFSSFLDLVRHTSPLYAWVSDGTPSRNCLQTAPEAVVAAAA